MAPAPVGTTVQVYSVVSKLGLYSSVVNDQVCVMVSYRY